MPYRAWLARSLTICLMVTPFVAAPSSPALAAPVVFSSTAVNLNGNNCMEVPDGNANNNVQLVQRACVSGAARQNFTFNPVAGTADQYTIATLTSGKCADIFGVSTADNATVIQWTCNTGNNQKFRLAPVTVSGTDKTFNLIAVHSGKCIVPAGGASTVNTGLVQLPCSTATSRVWRLPSFNPGTGTGSTFRNPLDPQGADPWLTFYNGFYYLAATTWNRTITMRKSATLGGLATAQEQVIFNLTNPNGAGTLWAPEFHLLTGPNGTRWYLYYTAGREPFNLNSQRIHVLESAGLDPLGPYTFKADMLDPQQDNTWELDGSILQLNGQLYLMGTFFNGSQPTFIRPLSNPWTASGTRRILIQPTLSWETVGGAVAEGPVQLNHNGKTFIVYSASHCSTPDYKLGMITYNGGDPLLQSSWTKSPNPVFQRSNANGVFGPGHNGFFKSPDGTEDWMVYHANASATAPCDVNRTTRAQKFTWNADGTPNFGVPQALTTVMASPSGQVG